MQREFEVTGLSDLYAALQELPVRIERNITRGALRAGVAVFRDEARGNVPKDSGFLRKSIKSESDVRRGKAYGYVRIDRNKGGAFYAHMLEFGTASYYTGSGRSKRQPYRIPKATIGRKKTANTVSKRLKFNTPGGFVIRNAVIHPGIKPTFFMRKAFDRKQKEAMDAFKVYVQNRLPIEVAKLR
jgi:HK97 gp10 family phage protein